MADADVRVIRKRTRSPAPSLTVAAGLTSGAVSSKALLGGPREQVCLTPEWLYGLLNARFGPFDFDPAPHPRPAAFDGLDPAVEWGKCNFVNPPFADLERWAQRAVNEFHEHGKESLLLIPARQQLRAWHDLLAGKYPMYPVLGYVRFRGYADELPHVLMVIWITKQVVPESHYRLAVGIQRPIDAMREAKKSDPDSKRRVTHDAACAEFPGALIEGNTILFRGPVLPFNANVDGKLSERRRKID